MLVQKRLDKRKPYVITVKKWRCQICGWIKQAVEKPMERCFNCGEFDWLRYYGNPRKSPRWKFNYDRFGEKVSKTDL